jgi:hypothetical protein
LTEAVIDSGELATNKIRLWTLHFMDQVFPFFSYDF